MEAIIKNTDIINSSTNKNGERLDPRSFIVPALGIAAVAYTGLCVFETPGITLVGIIPIILGIMLMIKWKASTFRYIGWQLGLTAISVTFTAFMFFGSHNGLAADTHLISDSSASLLTLIIGGYLPAAVNAAIYGKVSRSWKKTAVLVLTDPSFADAALITLGLFTGYWVA